MLPGTMKIHPRYNISILVLVGYGLILLAVVGLGWFAAKTMTSSQLIVRQIYEHPFAVSNAASAMKGDLLRLREQMIYIVMLRNRKEDVAELRHQADATAQAARQDLAVIKNGFLGDMGRVAALERQLDQWDGIRSRILDTAERGDDAEANRLVRTVGTPKFHEIQESVDYILSFAQGKAKYFVEAGEKQSAQLVLRTEWLLASLCLMIVGTGAAVFLRVRRLQDELNRQAKIDFLTGIPNRRHFMELAERELARCVRYGEQFVVAVVDLDLFKRINDAHGHHVGDQVLKEFCGICRKGLRETDVVGRIGGEEFAILLPRTDLAAATEVVERVRSSIEQTALQVGLSASLNFTASFGLATCPHAEKDLTTLFKHADQALYEAKRGGRNRVFVHPA